MNLPHSIKGKPVLGYLRQHLQIVSWPYLPSCMCFRQMAQCETWGYAVPWLIFVPNIGSHEGFKSPFFYSVCFLKVNKLQHFRNSTLERSVPAWRRLFAKLGAGALDASDICRKHTQLGEHGHDSVRMLLPWIARSRSFLFPFWTKQVQQLIFSLQASPTPGYTSVINRCTICWGPEFCGQSKVGFEALVYMLYMAPTQILRQSTKQSLLILWAILSKLQLCHDW